MFSNNPTCFYWPNFSCVKLRFQLLQDMKLIKTDIDLQVNRNTRIIEIKVSLKIMKFFGFFCHLKVLWNFKIWDRGFKVSDYKNFKESLLWETVRFQLFMHFFDFLCYFCCVWAHDKRSVVPKQASNHLRRQNENFCYLERKIIQI